MKDGKINLHCCRRRIFCLLTLMVLSNYVLVLINEIDTLISNLVKVMILVVRDIYHQLYVP